MGVAISGIVFGTQPYCASQCEAQIYLPVWCLQLDTVIRKTKCTPKYRKYSGPFALCGGSVSGTPVDTAIGG